MKLPRNVNLPNLKAKRSNLVCFIYIIVIRSVQVMLGRWYVFRNDSDSVVRTIACYRYKTPKRFEETDPAVKAIQETIRQAKEEWALRKRRLHNLNKFKNLTE